MVHPSQQRPPTLPRRQACLTLMRGGKPRVDRIRPWAAGLALSVSAILLTAYIAATAYLIYRDDLLGGTLARQVAMQYAYEDRIAALRSEIDRLASRHVMETAGVEEQLALLLERQEDIQRQQAAVDALVRKARDTGVDISVGASRLPQPKPATATLDPAGVEGALAYAPAGPQGTHPIARALNGGSVIAEGGSRGEQLKPLIFKIETSLDETEQQQSDVLDVPSARATQESSSLAATLAPIGLSVAESEAEGPQGGPFIAAGEVHFVEKAATLGRRLDEIASLRRSAEMMPVHAPVRAGRVSSGFGYRDDPFLHRPALHAGLDFAAAAGTEVRATAPGVVAAAGWNGAYGQMVEIRHAGGMSTRYGHLSAILVEEGAQVSAGTPIGRVESTGRSTGPHLHYETRRNGEAVNPAIYLAAGRAL
jgi:murein DD-endopeptidase MepM/ murein hydrolase activator NlpD